MIGDSILHYKIIEKLGEGGMGVVYKAEDTKLDRTVALKFLPANIAADPIAKERFLVEAKAAAALNHPNIATVHAIEESDEGMFIAMELVEGQNLKQKMETDPFTVSEAMAFAQQIAEGLHEAHKKGITHRDIKPPNIMVTLEGKAKIMDFGLAKLSEGSMLTKDGSTLGTAAYMSPEQAKGEEVDSTTDIWAFGVVLYELLCGQLPFKGEYGQAIIYSILNTDPEPISDKNVTLPDGTDVLLNKILDKDRVSRIGSFEEVIADLEALQSGAPITSRPPSGRSSERSAVTEKTRTTHVTVGFRKTVRKRTIFAVAAGLAVALFAGYQWLWPVMFPGDDAIDSFAILPFVNVTGDENAEYLSEGIPESLISSLGSIPGVHVTSFHSVLKRFKGSEPEASDVKNEFDVDAVVMGRITLRGEDVSVSIEIVETRDNKVLEAQNYIEKLSTLTELQPKISRWITDELSVQLSGEVEKKAFTLASDNPEAYNQYLIGRFQWRKRTIESLTLAIEHFEKALAEDPEYALAWSGLSDATINLYQYREGIGPGQIDIRSNDFKEAKAAAINAVKFGPEFAEAHSSYGHALFAERNFDEGRKAFETAIRLDPEYATAHFWFATSISAYEMKHEEALVKIEVAHRLEPYNHVIKNNLGLLYNSVMDFDKAAIAFEESISLAPGFYAAYGNLALTKISVREFTQALEHINMMKTVAPDDPRVGFTPGVVYYFNRQYENATSALQAFSPSSPWFLPARVVLFHILWLQDEYEKSIDLLRNFIGPFGLDSDGAIYNAVFRDASFTKSSVTSYVNAVIRVIRDTGHPIKDIFQVMIVLYAASGNADDLLREVERYYDSGDRWSSYLNLLVPGMEELHDDPRFVTLIKKMNVEKYFSK